MSWHLLFFVHCMIHSIKLIQNGIRNFFSPISLIPTSSRLLRLISFLTVLVVSPHRFSSAIDKSEINVSCGLAIQLKRPTLFSIIEAPWIISLSCPHYFFILRIKPNMFGCEVFTFHQKFAHRYYLTSFDSVQFIFGLFNFSFSIPTK